MNKLYSLLIAGCIFNIGSMSAQSYTDFTTESDIENYEGFMPFAISPNGRYTAGSTFHLQGFIYDFQTETLKVYEDTYDSQILDVNDEGVAIGFDENGGVMIDMEGNYTIFEGDGMVLPEKMSADAAIIVGSVADAAWVQKPCYWENGTMYLLDMPTEEEMGFRINGGTAIGVSSDGSVILGYIIDRMQTNPMLLWFRQDDGSYMLDPVCQKYFEPEATVYYDDDGHIIDIETGDNPYLQFKPGAITSDGKTVAMYVVENNKDINAPMLLGLYDIQADTLTIIEDPKGVFSTYGWGEFIISGIADDNTVVGALGSMMLGSYPFIMPGDTLTPDLLSDVYPQFDQLQQFTIEAPYGYPAFATGISANARYVVGYGTLPEYGPVGLAFLIDRGEEFGEPGGVESVIDLNSGVKVYTIQGVKVLDNQTGAGIESLPHGLYIINGKKVLL